MLNVSFHFPALPKCSLAEWTKEEWEAPKGNRIRRVYCQQPIFKWNTSIKPEPEFNLVKSESLSSTEEDECGREGSHPQMTHGKCGICRWAGLSIGEREGPRLEPLIGWMWKVWVQDSFKGFILSLCSPKYNLMNLTNKVVMLLYIFLICIGMREKQEAAALNLIKNYLENLQRKRESLKIKCSIVYKPRLNLSYCFILMANGYFL